MDMVLNYSVKTLTGEEILPSGTILTADVMAEVAERGAGKVGPMIRLLDFSTICKDLVSFFNAEPYHTIFGDPAKQTALLEQMSAVQLVPACLESLDYFRQHDFYTYRHILMVFALTTLLARDLVLDSQDRLREAYASPTHDLGKICIPLDVLKKRTPLTRAERRRLEHHPLAGYVLLSYYLGDHQHFSAAVARDHHERQGGGGYPRGLAEVDPLIEIITVCDIYDALISPRPYRPVSFDNRTAIEVLTRLCESRDIGWYVVKALVAHNRQIAFDPEAVWVSDEKRGIPPQGNHYGVLQDG